MKKLKQRIAFWVFKKAQEKGPHTVTVLGKTYKTDKDVFNPKFYMTSELMARNLDVGEGATVLDIGSGSGIQAITSAEKARKVIAIDINAAASRKTRENALRNSVGDKVFVLQGDLFGPLNKRAQFDLIIFTPPYMEGMPENKRDRAWFDPGKVLIKQFFEEAREYLKSSGSILMVYSSIADHQRALDIARNRGWKYAIVARKRSVLETFFIYRLTLQSTIY